jgi:hypothetical protein
MRLPGGRGPVRQQLTGGVVRGEEAGGGTKITRRGIHLPGGVIDWIRANLVLVPLLEVVLL